MPQSFKIFTALAVLFFTLTGCPADDDSGMPGGTTQDLAVTDPTITEGDFGTQNVSITITASGPVANGSSLRFATQNGTATSGEDYRLPDGAQVIFPTSGTLNLTFQVYGDLNREEDETFQVIFSDGVGVNTDGLVATITIVNDDETDNPFNIPTEGPDSPMSYDGYTLAWSDEFDDQSNFSTNYRHESGNGSGGWGNNELQFYQGDNTIIGDGHLIIEARKENMGGFNYTSSRIISKGKQEFTQGRIDVRAALPEGQGVWPAIWMLGANIDQVSWPKCGEIDIMEMLGHDTNTLYGTVHFANSAGGYQSNGGNVNVPEGLNRRFNVFTVIWTADHLEWRLNDVPYHRVERSVLAGSPMLDAPQFLLFNVAVGGNWPGSPNATTTFPQRMFIDYVRVFQ